MNKPLAQSRFGHRYRDNYERIFSMKEKKFEELIDYMNELEEALKFYADSRTYGEGNGLSWECCDIAKDLGEQARKVLRGKGK